MFFLLYFRFDQFLLSLFLRSLRFTFIERVLLFVGKLSCLPRSMLLLLLLLLSMLMLLLLGLMAVGASIWKFAWSELELTSSYLILFAAAAVVEAASVVVVVVTVSGVDVLHFTI